MIQSDKDLAPELVMVENDLHWVDLMWKRLLLSWDLEIIYAGMFQNILSHFSPGLNHSDVFILLFYIFFVTATNGGLMVEFLNSKIHKAPL